MHTANPTIPVPNSMLGMHSSDLGRHLDQCSAARGPWFAAAAFGERLHGLLAPRFISTLAVAIVILAASGWV